jgi:hypothetical protein
LRVRRAVTHPLADHQPDHDLGLVGPVVLRVAEHLKRHLRLAVDVGLGLAVGAGGVEEEQVDLEVEPVGAGEGNRLLHLRLRVRLHQQVEREQHSLDVGRERRAPSSSRNASATPSRRQSGRGARDD